MPGISAVKTVLPLAKKGISWPTYWATLISATVENAAPTHVVLTFAAANAQVTSADFAVTGFTVASGSWTGAVFTLVLSSAVLIFDGDLAITFKLTNTGTVTNNVADDGDTVAWYDYTDTESVIITDGKISEWEDKLGSGHDLLQANAANRMTLTAAGVVNSGVTETMKTAAFIYNQPCEVFLAIQVVTHSAGLSIIDGDTVFGTELIHSNPSPNINLKAGGAGIINTGVTIGEFQVIRLLLNGANSELQINDLETFVGNAGANNMGGVYLRRSNYILKEAICRKAASDDTLQSNIKKSMYRRWSIDLHTTEIPTYTTHDIHSIIASWSDFVMIGGNLVVFSPSSDETHVDGTGQINIINPATWTQVGSTITHNFGHCNTVHYDSDSDVLMIGNLPGNATYPVALYLLYDFSTLLSEASLDFDAIDKTIIKLNASPVVTNTAGCFAELHGSVRDYAYVCGAYNAQWLKIQLGMGANNLGQGVYSEAAVGKYNGSYAVLDSATHTLKESSSEEVCGGIDFYDGKILTCNGHTGIRGSIWEMAASAISRQYTHGEGLDDHASQGLVIWGDKVLQGVNGTSSAAILEYNLSDLV